MMMHRVREEAAEEKSTTAAAQMMAHKRGQGGSALEVLGVFGGGGGRRFISVGTAIDRDPFLPTARTAKKCLSVETPLINA
jgi:hypothetical protein